MNSIVPYNLYEAQSAYKRLQMSLTRESAAAAILEIKTFLKIFPDVALAHNDLGVLYHQSGENLLALAHYEKANRMQPKTSTIIKNIAEFYAVELGWLDDAIIMLTEQLTATPQDDEIIVSLGMICERVGRPEEACTFFKRALEIKPNDPELRETLARLGGPVSAAEYRAADPAAIIEPPIVVAEEFADEIAALKQKLVQNPSDPVANNNLAVIRSHQNNYEESANLYQRAVAADPGNPLYRKNLADVYYSALGKTDEAVEIYTSLLTKYPKDTELLFAVATISKNNNLNEQARTFINKVIELEPWNMEARDLLASLKG